MRRRENDVAANWAEWEYGDGHARARLAKQSRLGMWTVVRIWKIRPNRRNARTAPLYSSAGDCLRRAGTRCHHKLNRAPQNGTVETASVCPTSGVARRRENCVIEETAEAVTFEFTERQLEDSVQFEHSRHLLRVRRPSPLPPHRARPRSRPCRTSSAAHVRSLSPLRDRPAISSMRARKF